MPADSQLSRAHGDQSLKNDDQLDNQKSSIQERQGKPPPHFTISTKKCLPNNWTFVIWVESGLDKKEESTTDVDFSYKDVSQLSEATDDVYAESVAEAEDADLKDYNRLI